MRTIPFRAAKRENARKVSQVKHELTQTLGRVPTQDELAEHTGHSLYELECRDEDQLRAISLEHVLYENDHGSRETLLGDTIVVRHPAADDDADRFEELTRGLSERAKGILWLYYWEGLSMHEIGEQLELSESRISQMHAQIVQQLRRRKSA